MPGTITGPVTTIFKTLIANLVEDFGYDVSNLLAIPYDWRLAPSKLEQRDQFFTKLKIQIEVFIFSFFLFFSFF